MSEQGAAPAASTDAPAETQAASIDRILELLRRGRIKLEGLLDNSSNYTFLATVSQPDLRCLAIYKPQRGERPLWDFPCGTLCKRECATFLISLAMGWVFVPPTVLRRGPHGLGALQLYIDAIPEGNFFSLREQFAPVFQRLCAFDYVVNNADRKGGHCLLGKDGRIWAIDHGITLNEDFKLRTVIWDWAGQPLPEEIVASLRILQRVLDRDNEVTQSLAKLLRRREMTALRARLSGLLSMGTFPQPDPALPNIPWPPI